MKEWGICMQGNEAVISTAIIKVIEKHPRNYPFHYVEIGVAEGKTFSAICELLNSKPIDWSAAAIELPNGWSFNGDEFLKNTKEWDERIVLSLNGSPAALDQFADKSVHVILIDGSHSKESVIADFLASDRILAPGGIIIFHDTDSESQGLDVFSGQPEGIQVRIALQELGLLYHEINENYKLITDFPGDKSQGGRGVVIINKLKG